MRTIVSFILILVCSMTVFPHASLAQNSRPMVRLIYFLPNDREPDPDIDARLDGLIKGVQQFYANQMATHGFGRKTFQIETNAEGKAVVHYVIGKFADAYYTSGDDAYAKAWTEVRERFTASQHVDFVVIDTSNQSIGGYAAGIALPAKNLVALPASGRFFNQPLAAHELGHIFGLEHDFRSTAYIMSMGPWGLIQLSKCAAEILDFSPFFNTGHQSQRSNSSTTIKMHPPLAAPSFAIRLRFEVTDADGLHQAQLYAAGLIACKQLNGNKRTTVEFVTLLKPGTNAVFLRTIDVHGNISFSEGYPIDVVSLLPPPTVVSIPDANLAAAVRETLDLAPGSLITTHKMLNLRSLSAGNLGIIDLTGLEHAHLLSNLNLGEAYNHNEKHPPGWDYWVNSNSISDISPLAGLTQLTQLQLEENAISDVSPLASLAQLQYVDLSNNAISDVSPLASLAQLTDMDLSYNPISDVSGLSTLTQLQILQFYDCKTISDVSGLSTLTQLQILNLGSNAISDVSPLASLTQLESLNLGNNNINDVSPLASLTQLESLDLRSNNINDVSPLASLTQLEVLRLYNNAISDVSPFASLTQLRSLWLSGNAIADVSPLVTLDLPGTKYANTPLGTPLDLRWNPLSYASVNTHIPAIQAKSIEVKFENRAHSALLKISGDAQNGASGAALPTPFVVEAMNESGKPMQGVSVTFTVTIGGGRLSRTIITTDARGRAQTTLTLGQRASRNTVRATAEGIQSFAIFNATATQAPTRLVADVNSDGVVNIQDIVFVALRLGQAEENKADVNGDGVVNIQDLVFVAGELGADAAAPSAWHHTSFGVPTRATVEQWLLQAHGLQLTDARSQRGVLLLERFFAALAPEETALLGNYPNPFNPETWIPYHLSESADVTLTIYAIDGKVVRRLDLGHQVAGFYQSKSRAAHWDGRNNVGERVASGIYFYTLRAGDFAATKKMLILK